LRFLFVSVGARRLRPARELRAEEDYRAFRSALWSLHEAADNDRRVGHATHLSRDVLQAQTRLKGTLGLTTRIILTRDAAERLQIALDGHRNPVDVYSGASFLLVDVDNAWDARATAAAAAATRRRSWPAVDGLFGRR